MFGELCVFCVFLWGSNQLGAVLCIRLVFLLDRIAQKVKFVLSSNYSVLMALEQIHDYKTNIIAKMAI